MLSSINSAITMEMNSTMDYYNGCEEDERIRNLFPSNNLLNQLKSFDFTLFYTTNEIDEDKRYMLETQKIENLIKMSFVLLEKLKVVKKCKKLINLMRIFSNINKI